MNTELTLAGSVHANVHFDDAVNKQEVQVQYVSFVPLLVNSLIRQE